MSFLQFLKNKALWIAATGVAIYFLSVAAIGVFPTRDAVAVLSVIISLLCLYLFMFAAWEAFKAGGEQARSRLLMGTNLFWLAIMGRETWGWVVRYYDRPQWMLDHPINGFFAYMIVASGLLHWSATTQEIPVIRQSKIYWFAVGGVAGLLAGIMLARVLWIH